MMHDEAARIGAFTEIFPSRLLWERSAVEWVALADLLEARPTYQMRFERMIAIDQPKLVVTEDQLRQLVSRFDLSQLARTELIDILFVLAGWQLADQHQVALGADYDTFMRALDRVRRAAKSLSDELGDLPAECNRILSQLIPSSEQVLGIAPLLDLERQAYNLVVALEGLRPEISRKGAGRRQNAVLAVTVQHLVESLERLTGDRIKMTRLDKGDGQRLLAPGLGQFIKDFFQLFPKAPAEATLVRLIKQARSKPK